MAAAAATHSLFGNADLQFGHDAAGHIQFNVNDGAVMACVNGATITYIPAEFRYHVDANTIWQPDRDFNALVAAGWDVRSATLVGMLRQVLPRINNLALSASETTQDNPVAHVITQAEADLLAARPFLNALETVAQQAYTIFLANAHLVVSQRHHYFEDNKEFQRLVDVVFAEDVLDQFGEDLADIRSAAFHHCFHVVSLATFDRIGSGGAFTGPNAINLLTKVHGLVNKRHPASPAGTMLVRILRAVWQDLASHRAMVGVRPLVEGNLAAIPVVPACRWYAELVAVEVAIRNSPGDWNQLSPTANTIANMIRVSALEDVVATLAGIATGLGMGRSTQLKAKSVAALKKRKAGPFANGAAIGEALMNALPAATLATATAEIVGL